MAVEIDFYMASRKRYLMQFIEYVSYFNLGTDCLLMQGAVTYLAMECLVIRVEIINSLKRIKFWLVSFHFLKFFN